MRGIGLVGVPPLEQLPGLIDRSGEQHEPGRAQLGLVAELGGGPLRRCPDTGDHDREDDQNLANEELGRGHSLSPARCKVAQPKREQESERTAKNEIALIYPNLRLFPLTSPPACKRGVAAHLAFPDHEQIPPQVSELHRHLFQTSRHAANSDGRIW